MSLCQRDLHFEDIQFRGALCSEQSLVQGKVFGGLRDCCLAQNNGILVAEKRVIVLLDLVDDALHCRIIGDLGYPEDSLCLLHGACRASPWVAVEYRLAAGEAEGAHLVSGVTFRDAVLGGEANAGRGA